ncbi:MAG: glycine betaine ABC transporter substrate-binding protein, partial [Myxococcota bacterium]
APSARAHRHGRCIPAIRPRPCSRAGISTNVAFQAMMSGSIDMYPEYLGTAWYVLLRRNNPPSSKPLQAYLQTQVELRKRFQVEWLMPFGFNNRYALAVHKETAKRYGLKTISDLNRYPYKFSAAFTHEFIQRKDGFRGLKEHYRLKVAPPKGVEHGLSYQALLSKRVDIIEIWTTDGKLISFPIRALIDDQNYFPPYQAIPLIRQQTLKQFPQLRPILQKLAFRIDARTMQSINAKLEQKQPFAKVAQDFINTLEGLPRRKTSSAESKNLSFLGFMWQRRTATWRLLQEHLLLTFLAALLAVCLALPFGIFLSQYPKVAPSVLNLVGVIQTIPSLALLALLIPIPLFGLGTRSAIFALFLYALLPILQNTYTGMRSIRPSLLEAAKGIGCKPHQTLLRVQLPLALPTIMAGLRTAVVIGIGIATIAAFVGAGGLGDPIITGLNLNDPYLILSGALPAAILAILADLGLRWFEKTITPRK